MYRLAVLNSHPIQYFAPLYRRLSQEPDIDLTVYFARNWGAEAYYDPDFGEKIQWDIPLLDGYKHKFLPNWRRETNSKGFFSLVNPAIIGELKQERYDALWIHGHNYATYIMAIGAAKLFGTSLFMRCETHLDLQRSPLKQSMRKPLMTLFYRWFDACLPIGTRNAEFYRFHGVPEQKLFLVPYSVDNQFFREKTRRYQQKRDDWLKELSLPDDKPIILFASKLTNRKHPLDLLQAFHRLRQNQIEVALIFVGSGAEENTLKQYVTEQQVPDVYFFGFRNQTELPKFYAIGDIFVLPSANEPWGLIVNEVMAAGLPVIASNDVGAATDLVTDGFNGFTFPVGNVEALADKLRKLVCDENLRKEMGHNAWVMIDDWDFEKCVTGLRMALASVDRG